MRLAIGLLICASALHAGEACLSPDSVWKMKSVAAPQLSPDGRSIVYVYSWPDRNTDSYYSNLHLIVPGAKDRALTDGDYQDNQQ